MTEEGTKSLMAFILNSDDNEKFKKDILQMMEQNHLPYKIALNNAEVHNVLGNCVEPLSLATMLAFDIDNPGKANLFLIDLLNFYFEKGRPATVDDVSMDIYPFGFYCEEDITSIIDNALKINKVYIFQVYIKKKERTKKWRN
jgi:hypothetical protein